MMQILRRKFRSRLVKAALLSTMAFFSFSCGSPEAGEVIPGSWAVEEAKTTMPGVHPQILRDADNKEQHTKYQFADDGTFIMEGPEIAGSHKGYWRYNPADSTISLLYYRPLDTLSYDLKLVVFSRDRMQVVQSYFELGETRMTLVRN